MRGSWRNSSFSVWEGKCEREAGNTSSYQKQMNYQRQLGSCQKHAKVNLKRLPLAKGGTIQGSLRILMAVD